MLNSRFYKPMHIVFDPAMLAELARRSPPAARVLANISRGCRYPLELKANGQGSFHSQ